MKKIDPKFKPGDRVVERPRTGMILHVRQEKLGASRVFHDLRSGVIFENLIKVQTGRARTTRQWYVKVLWDGMQTPSEHSQCRIMLESDAAKNINNFAD